MPTIREAMGASVLGGKLFAVGGQTNNGFVTGIVEVYDPKTDTWSTATSMPTPRDGLATREIGGRLYAIGGYDGIRYVDTVEAFSPH
jgi:N-acetylneuraminic acid mutarotase